MFFESLARLAYNKGTALFRGNDPLQRSAAGTFWVAISDASNMLDCGTVRENTTKPQVRTHGQTGELGGTRSESSAWRVSLPVPLLLAINY